ncbi:hypothetical protein KUTeg_004874 [Tegillarca granosa]|uniref:Uncharacterized protein n=1 Tax=Tegillarca granosa TaxID=220873 RepID=A0ABQ9FI49_TEGGR|nr:hypothetical protein KUTeg_004874 [Tegillarca granosa]
MKVTILALLCVIGAVSAAPRGIFNYPKMGIPFNPFFNNGYFPGIGMNAGFGFNKGFPFYNGFGAFGGQGGFVGGRGGFSGGAGGGYYCKSFFQDGYCIYFDEVFRGLLISKAWKDKNLLKTRSMTNHERRSIFIFFIITAFLYTSI